MLQLMLAPGLFSEADIRMGLCLPPAPTQSGRKDMKTHQ